MQVRIDVQGCLATGAAWLTRSLCLLRRAMNVGRDAVVELAYPDVCVLCLKNLPTHQERDAAARSVRFCSACQLTLTTKGHAACRKCGAPVGPHLPTVLKCLRCRTRDFRFREVIRLGVYEDELRQAVIRGKELNAMPLSSALTELLLFELSDRLKSIEADVLTCVPQHWWKRLFTSHHQAETIAEIVSTRLQLPFDRHLIRKSRATQDQSELPREARLRNLNSAFRVPSPRHVSGKTVVLIDDVLTTGSTANECTKALRKAGAKAVIVVVIARVA